MAQMTYSKYYLYHCSNLFISAVTVERRKMMLWSQNNWDLNTTGWLVYETTDSISNRIKHNIEQAVVSIILQVGQRNKYVPIALC
jgi:hypothetical protein